MAVPETEVPHREAMPMTPSGPCWICGGAAMDPVFPSYLNLRYSSQFGPHAHDDHPPYNVVRCRRCGFGQPDLMPALENYFDLLYGQPWWTPESLAAEFANPFKDAVFAAVLAGLDRRMRPGVPRTLLDVGCHVGRFLHLARQAGWEVEGAELNPLPAEYAASQTGLKVYRSPAQDLIGMGHRYGAVTLTDVLEHIPHPAPLVAQLRELLHPGGVVAIKVPHGMPQRVKERIRAARHPGREAQRDRNIGVGTSYIHVNHFSVESLRQCLERAGFREVRVVSAPPEYVPPGPTRSRGQALSSLLRLGVYHAGRLVPGGLRSPLCLNLQAFGVNPG